MLLQEEILFKEEQKFKQSWIWLILICGNIAIAYGVFRYLMHKELVGEDNESGVGLFIGFGIMLLLTLFFYILKLQTLIKNDGIYVRFIPFHNSYRKYTWDQITGAYVREYSALSEFGGWGLRFGDKGNALNVSGNNGLQLELLNKRNLLIGTNKPDEIKKVLLKIGVYKL